ncbi:MAG: ABC transporter ATP-binding protein [Chloroflexota bacterium]
MMKHIDIVRQIFRLVWRASPLFFIGLLCLTLIMGLLPVATIALNAQLIETLVAAVQGSEASESLMQTFLILLGLLGATRMAELLVTRIQTAVQNLYQTRVTNYVRLMIAEKAAYLDLPLFENPEFYNLMTNASNETSYRPFLMVTQLMTVIATFTTLLSVTIILFLWQPWIPPIMILSSVALLWIAAHFNRARVQLTIDRTPDERRSVYFNALLTGDWAVKEIRLFGLQRFMLDHIRTILSRMYVQDRRLERRQLLFSGPSEVLLSVVPIVFIGYAAFQVIQQRLSIGGFSLYMQSILQLESGLTNLMTSFSHLHEHQLFIANLLRFLELQPHIEAPRPEAALAKQKLSAFPRIEFHNVSFRYPSTNTDIIRNLNLTIHPGEKIALVGENGEGKTTLVKLMTGLYEPTEGHISFDGVDVRHLDRKDLRDYMSVIFQDYYIYHLSLYENVALGRIDDLHDRARVAEAAQKSGLDRLVAQLPAGYDTVLLRMVDVGHELSGGQRQLVAITRALVRNAPILVLDEPTASLDAEAEERFFEALLEKYIFEQQTVVFISHRFSTIRRADRILVLKGGTLVEDGSHAELMALNGRYARMFNTQAKMYVAPHDAPVNGQHALAVADTDQV